VRQVDELVAEVTSASKEQTQGITQVNTAVGQMDKVTQSNAANAEESAAAAEELNAQAGTMKHTVAELLKLVGGNREATAIHQIASPVRAKDARIPMPAATRSATTRKNGRVHAEPALASVATNGRSEIPLEGGFKDF